MSGAIKSSQNDSSSILSMGAEILWLHVIPICIHKILIILSRTKSLVCFDTILEAEGMPSLI